MLGLFCSPNLSWTMKLKAGTITLSCALLAILAIVPACDSKPSRIEAEDRVSEYAAAFALVEQMNIPDQRDMYNALTEQASDSLQRGQAALLKVLECRYANHRETCHDIRAEMEYLNEIINAPYDYEE